MKAAWVYSVLFLCLLLTSCTLTPGAGMSSKRLKRGAVSGTAKNTQMVHPKGVVARVNHHDITQSELDYQIFRMKLIAALQKGSVQESMNKMTALTALIRLQAIDTMAKNKGIAVTDGQIHRRVDKQRKSLSRYPVANQMIKAYGVDKFWKNETARYRTIINEEMLLDLLKAGEREKDPATKQEQPNANDEKKWAFNSRQDLEDLIVAQVQQFHIENYLSN